ncbi:hypothetical protein A0256_23970 [Mucilaginibacter sp. PAMC 26640]|nr:hypothetical protein A0256_23970 [Mucilaginibacter sp. PAMC 26640]
MKKKLSLWFLPVLLLFAMAVNSCKKEDKSNIPSLLTTGQWELASLLVYHNIGDSQISVDTLNTNCDTSQMFKFFKDGSCTYTNFDCKPQPTANGTWKLSDTKITLVADITCQDTITGSGTSKPFLNSQIVNLGEYSLVLQTGDIQPYYAANQPRVIFRYGFIRQKVVNR